MKVPFIGSEAVVSGELTPYALRSKFTAIYPDVYVPRDVALTARSKAVAAWLWSGRHGVVAGRSASALYGAKWVDTRLPAELIWTNRRPPNGIRCWSDTLSDDEFEVVDGICVTTPARTALDIARQYPFEAAVMAIDALARRTRLKVAHIELLADRYQGRRGIRQARKVIEMVDPGAESPRESSLRLLLVRAGFPRPTTQIPVYDQYGVLVAVLDMGWEDVKIAAEYDGDHHRTDRRTFNNDIRRSESVNELGWIHIRVTAEDTEGGILHRVATAFARRT
ncbi:hypothetical protein BayCH28_27015 [Mycolicibacterium sp. CH28]|uniref:hypothetical protein n=1 Tax=Mycolicibacterium sp. CH28 TaxID=2512237 RepID=UPI001080EEB3|nr:hypothetical protein [Mycolicibacterium sp. CH28]TGD84078.1 hypothetical protein BayCH28_27015 [Mycolicibacterium sp. CH28]